MYGRKTERFPIVSRLCHENNRNYHRFDKITHLDLQDMLPKGRVGWREKER